MQNLFTNNFIGQSGLIWAIGIVESRNDPLHLGRALVRCFGIHTEDKIELPTEDLPWARVMTPVTNSKGIPTYKDCLLYTSDAADE